MEHSDKASQNGNTTSKEDSQMDQHENKNEGNGITKEEILDEAIEHLEDALIELEEYAKLGKVPPKNKRYLIRIDKTKYEVNVHEMTGRQLLDLAGKKPPENFLLTQKFRGGATKKIELNETVDFTTPGIERFMTLPLDQTEG
jgi:hypothetical protein